MVSPMTLEHLRYFVQIYDHLSLNAAAQQLYISQPALSKSLQTMEKKIGTILFVRSKKGLYPTNAGKLLYKTALQILSLYNDTLQQINKNLTFQEPLTIFVPPCIANTYFSFVMKNLCDSFPNLKLHVQEYLVDKLPSLLKIPTSFILTMGSSEIKSFLESFPDYKYILLKEEPCYAFISKNSPLAKEKVLSSDAKFDNNISLHEFNSFHQYDKKYIDVNYITNFSISQEIILSQNGVHILPVGLGKKVYTHPEIISIPLERDIKVLYGLIIPQKLLTSEFSFVINYTIDLLKKSLNESETL